ncbi:MAG: FAD-binding protein [bacterium]|nr:FAD-binding protein [bacterium]
MPPSPFELLREQLSFPDSLIIEPDYTHEKYFKDATNYSGKPSAILMARVREDVQAAVRFCSQHSIPVVPRGGGTGLSGGCVPSSNSLVISTELIAHQRINTATFSAFVGPGVITKTLQDEAAKIGLTYPPDPASYLESTLGGNVAEGAGGLRCRRFGVTKDYVLGLEAVLADGSLLKTGILGQQSGFGGLGELLVASEGTLAIITEIALRLIPIPTRGATILVAFPHPTKAAKTVSDITAEGIIPTVLEFLDGDAAACSNQYEKHDGLDDVAAILLIETTGIDPQKETAQIRDICSRNGCSYLRAETDAAKAETLWAVRRNLSKAIRESAALRISEDVAVPNSQFPVLVDFVAEMNAASPLRINSFGHAGDGNLHVNFLSSTGSEADRALIEEGILTLMKKTIALGGTLTGEHGIGLAKRQYLPLEFPPATISAMRQIKHIFDPNGALNPGKLLPD